MKLLGKRLIELRKRRGMGQARLARLSRVSRRQIVRIESEPDAVRRRHTVENLARALGVEPEVLTGATPMPAASGAKAVESGSGEAAESVSARVPPDVRLAYDLVSLGYGIAQSDLVRMAPLLFTVLAEGSLAWRRRKIDEVLELAEQMRNVMKQPNGASIGHLAFAASVYRAEEGAGWEQESIDKGDVLGLELGDGGGFENDAYQFGFDPQEGNAFVDYLRMLAMEAGSPEFVSADDIAPDDDGLPDYKVCRRTLDRVSGGSEEFRRDLESLTVRIRDIPDFLTIDFRQSRRGEAETGLGRARRLWFEGKRSGRHHPIIQERLDKEAGFEEAMAAIFGKDAETEGPS